MFRSETTLTQLELAILAAVDPQGALESLAGVASESVDAEDDGTPAVAPIDWSKI